MRHHITLLGIALAVSMCLPISAFAVKAHIGYNCTDCHKAGANPRAMANVCTPCHGSTPVPGAYGSFTRDKASDALGNHPDHALINYIDALPGDQTSHFWGASTISAQLAAGVTTPPTTFYRSSYGISTNKITCSICHDPHGHSGTQLLRMTKDNDLICQQCHTGFYHDYPNAVVTHPVGATVVYADALAADVLDPGLDKYKLIPENTAQGGIILVNGVVSCSSCHAPHFADSDSSTADGIANVGSLHKGDSHMLKANGPFAANNSLLCQTCHTYMAHGKMADGGESVGCLTCHSAHIPVGNSNVYVLRNSVTTATYGTKTITYTTTNTIWNDNVAVTRTGYCEVCHNSAELIPKGAGFHQVGAICRDCHLHQVDGGTYSFQNDANAASCGDCHGFPPYLNERGDRNTGGTDGGYAYVSAAYNYFLDGGYKNEVLTPHNTHAAGGMTQGTATTDYIFGTGVLACDPCHLDMSTAPTHDAGAPGSYQNLAWNPLSTGGGILAPSYATSGNASVIWKCSNTYCHSNGGRRDPDGTKELADYTLAVTPAWLAGDNTIIGNAARCNFCHGNTAATMVTKNNSTSHQNHLGSGGAFGKTYSCKVCHESTADSSTALSITGTNPRLVKDGGTHVNGSVNVSFNSTFNLGSGTLGTGSYVGGATGTCTVYCHSNGRAPYTAITAADWDTATTGDCGACHSTVAASLSAPHSKHLAIANVTCNSCHFTVSGDATLGTHTGHVDGAFTFSQTACNSCHGWESGETTPAWGQPMSNAYCLTCHAGNVTGILPTMTAPTKQHASDRGHNRTTNYPSGNAPGNKQCTSCHLTTITNHVNVTDGDATHLIAAAATCTTSCHGVGGSAVGTNTKGIITHVAKACTACHDPHGDTTQTSNIYMIRSKSTGNFASDATPVVYTNTGSEVAPLTASNSYDEDDDGSSSTHVESNADDLCATCHTVAGGTAHNNRDNSQVGHYQGRDCFSSCHKSHQEAAGAFVSGGGSQCNDCHGNPPLSNAQLKTYGQQYGAHAAHTFITTPLPGEDRTDCEICHPGAATYSLSHANGGGAVNLDPRIVAGSLGGGNYSCATFNSDLGCHASSATDGFWTDIDDAPYVGNGLNCTACHNASGVNDGVLANAAPNSGAHAKHRVANKTCTDCHNNGVAITDTTHINSFSYAGAADDGAAVTDKAIETLGEGAVLRNLTTYDQVTNFTCTGGIGLACHNSKVTPNWRTFTNIACTNCHNPITSDAADPKTGLHNIGATEAAAGVKKHDSTLGTNGCTECHNSTKPAATHANGIFLDNSAVRTDRFLTARGAEVTWWADNATANRGTCFGTAALASCHSDGGNWTRVWSTEANSTATASGSARCNVCHGQYSTLSGSGGRGWNAGTSHYQTYGGATSTRGSTHKSLPGENNACEDCHSFTTQNSNHENGSVTINSDATILVTRLSNRVYCDVCHDSGDPLVSGTFTFTQSGFPQQVVVGVNDPKQECNSCHGNGTGRFWPMAAYGGGHAANDGGRHEKHLTRLARSKYNMTVDELLADADVKNKQIELCRYCHYPAGTPGTTNHTDTGYPAEVSPTVYALWDTTRTTPDTITYTGTGANGTGTCANVNCHNEKNTNVLGATFAWHASGTGNCVLCHNDITNTTAGTTGATHQAHLAPTKFGRAVVCGDCHGGTVSTAWSAYTEPATLHINGQFRVTGGTVIDGTIRTYTGSYTNQATRTVGTCATNLCHNNGAGGTPYNGNGAGTYTWQTAMTDCTACHRNDTNLGSSHTPHLTAAVATFGKTPICVDCHEAVSATDMTGKANHINGAVTIASLAPMSAMTYSGAPGTLNVVIGGGNTYGACTGSCHTNGKAAGTPAVTATWNAAQAANCTICHLAPNTAGNDGARHSKHYNAHNNYVAAAKCGECHVGATLTTYNSSNHLSGTVQTGNKITAHTAGSATCTNSCHVVDVSRGDWLDTAVLGCADCHVAGKIAATAGAMPTSGLHNITPRISGQKHDATLHANGCEVCHTTIRAATTTHIKGSFPADTTSNTDRGLFSPTYSDASGSCSGTAVNQAALCHQDNGKWGRKWSTSAQNNDGSECSNCHGGVGLGYVVTAWSSGVGPDHTIDRNGDFVANEVTTSNHSVCKTCHGFNSDADKDANYVNKHRDSNITMNLTTNYIEGNWGCDNAQCHLGGGAGAHGLADSGWFVERVSFTTTGGACDQCHGYPPLPPGYVNGVGNYEKGKPENYPGGGSGHAIVKHLAKNILPANGWTPCSPCHYDDANNHDMGGNVTDRDGVDNIPGNADDSIQVEIDPARDYKVPALYQKGLPNTTDGMGQCRNVNCHFTESPKWDCTP